MSIPQAHFSNLKAHTGGVRFGKTSSRPVAETRLSDAGLISNLEGQSEAASKKGVAGTILFILTTIVTLPFFGHPIGWLVLASLGALAAYIAADSIASALIQKHYQASEKLFNEADLSKDADRQRLRETMEGFAGALESDGFYVHRMPASIQANGLEVVEGRVPTKKGPALHFAIKKRQPGSPEFEKLGPIAALVITSGDGKKEKPGIGMTYLNETKDDQDRMVFTLGKRSKTSK